LEHGCLLSPGNALQLGPDPELAVAGQFVDDLLRDVDEGPVTLLEKVEEGGPAYLFEQSLVLKEQLEGSFEGGQKLADGFRGEPRQVVGQQTQEQQGLEGWLWRGGRQLVKVALEGGYHI
jgi:hypothetical protein